MALVAAELQLQVSANVVASLLILFTLVMEVIHSS
jgi:hypothetical protein